MNQKATQIVKVHIGDTKPKRRRAKRKVKVKSKIIGTGLQPVMGIPQYGQIPIPAPFARQGWTLEPVIAKQAEQPAIQRIQQEPQMNLLLPNREIRDYMGRMLESQFNVGGRSGPVIEEMPTAPPSPRGRVEKPPAPLVSAQQPPLVRPPAIKIEEERKREEEPAPQLVFIDESNPRHFRTAEEMQSLRDEGKLTRPFLNAFTKLRSAVRENEMSLEDIASKLGIYIPAKIRNGAKENFITYILEKSG